MNMLERLLDHRTREGKVLACILSFVIIFTLMDVYTYAQAFAEVLRGPDEAAQIELLDAEGEQPDQATEQSEPAGEAEAPADEPASVAAPADEPAAADEPASEPAADEPAAAPAPAEADEPAAEPAAEPAEPTLDDADATPADGPIAAEPAADDEPAPAADEPAAPVAPALTLADLYPAQRFAGAANNINVTVNAPEGALPAGTTMRVTPVAYNDVVDAVQEALGSATSTMVAIDISFYDATGAAIEPNIPIDVKFTSAIIKAAEEPVVVHIPDEGKGDPEVLPTVEANPGATTTLTMEQVATTEEAAETTAADVAAQVEAEAAAQATLEVASDDFSVYVIVGQDGADPDNARVTYKFLMPASYDEGGNAVYDENNAVLTVTVKKGDSIPNPGVPVIDSSNQSFFGWTTASTPTSASKSYYVNELEDLLREAKRVGYSTDVAADADPSSYTTAITETNMTPETVNLYAKVLPMWTVKYVRPNGSIQKTERVAQGDMAKVSISYDAGASDKPTSYVDPETHQEVVAEDSDDYSFVGWKVVTADGASNKSIFDGQIMQKDATFLIDTNIELHAVVFLGSFIEFDENDNYYLSAKDDNGVAYGTLGTLYEPALGKAFDESIPNESKVNGNADFNGAVFVKKGHKISEYFKGTDGAGNVQLPQPTYTGYTFDGWYTAAIDGSSVSYSTSDLLNVTTRLYAHWTPVTTTYHVVYWTQNVDNLDLYDYVGSKEYTATTHDQIALSSISGSTSVNTLKSLTSNSDLQFELGHYFELNTSKTKVNDKVLINGDGSATLNVYYDRRMITINFWNGTGSNKSIVNGWKFEGPYGTAFTGSWTDISAYSKWQMYENNSPSNGGGIIKVSPLSTFTPSPQVGGQTTWDFYSYTSSSSVERYISFYLQTADGSGYEWKDTVVSNSTGAFSVSASTFLGFSPYAYISGSSENDVSSFNEEAATKFGAESSVPSDSLKLGYTAIYYNRIPRTFSFHWNGESNSHAKSISLLAGVSINNALDAYSDLIANGPTANTVDDNGKAEATSERVYFDGWYSDPTYSEKFNFDEAVMPDSNVAVYAKWTKIKFRFVAWFNSGETFPDGVSQKPTFRPDWGETISMSGLKQVQLEGYTLDGFYFDKGFKNPVPDSDMEASPSIAQPYPTDEAERQAIQDYHYKWYGSYKPDEANVQYVIYVYPKWSNANVTKEVPIHVTYKLGDGSMTVDGATYTGSATYTDTTDYMDNAYVITPNANVTAPDGLQFAGWKLTHKTGAKEQVFPGGEFLTNVNDAVMESNVWYITLEAIYTAPAAPEKTYITYRNDWAQDEEISVPVMVEVNEQGEAANSKTIALSAAQTGFTQPAGYKAFKEWNTVAEPSAENPGVSIKEGVTIAADSTGTALYTTGDGQQIYTNFLYAQWAPNEFTVKFDANGGEGDTVAGAMADQTFYYNVASSLTPVAYTNGNRPFLGWNTEANGSGISYSDMQTLTNPVRTYDAETDSYSYNFADGATITLYAQWGDVTYNITYAGLEGATVPGGANPTTYSPAQGTLSLVDPVRANYAFLGWTGSNGDTPRKGLTMDVSRQTGDLSFTANWGALSGKVIYHADDEDSIAPIEVGVSPTSDVTTAVLSESSSTNWEYASYSPYRGWYNQQRVTTDITKTQTTTVYATTVSLLPAKSFDRVGYHIDGWAYVDGAGASVGACGADVTLTNSNQYVETTTSKTYTTGSGKNTKTKHIYGYPKTVLDSGSKDYQPVNDLYAQWAPNTYIVTFNKNNGTGTQMLAQSFTYDTEQALSANTYTRTGYEFAGWNTERDGSGTSYTNEQAVKNLTAENGGNVMLYAQWKGAEVGYKVEVYLKNTGASADKVLERTGEADSTATAAATDADVVDYLNSLAGETYIFDESNANNKLHATVAADGSTVLRLYFYRTYTVKYVHDAAGYAKFTEIEKTGLRYNDETPAPPTDGLADVDGYRFAGWDPAWSDKVTADVTYTATWAPIADTPYTVSYYYMNDDGSYPAEPTSSNHPGGATGTTVEVTADQKTPTRVGYAFDDGNEDNVLSGVVTAGAAGELVLKVYFKKQYTVTFAKGDHAADGVHDVVISGIDRNKKLGDVLVDSNGKSLIPSWQEGATGYTRNSEQLWDTAINEDATVTSDLVFTALWKPIAYTVAFDANGGTGAIASQSFTYGVEQALTKNETAGGNTEMTRAGYTFNGWNEKPDGAGDSHEDAEVVSNLSTTNDATVTLYAQWNPITYTIEYNANLNETTHATGTMASQQFTGADESVALQENGFEYTGYSFNQWAYADGTAAAGTKLIDKADEAHVVNVYATWTPNTDTKYTVEYYQEKLDGTGYELRESDQSRTGTTGATVSAEERTFAGFRINKTAEGTVASGTIAGDGSLVLKLYYDRNKYTVHYVYTGTAPAGADAFLPVSDPVYKYGQAIENVPQPVVTGYHFSGWSVGDDKLPGENLVAGEGLFANDTTNVLGNWGANTDTKYTISHYWVQQNAQGGTVITLQQSEVGSGTTGATTAPVTAKTYGGYVFDPNYEGSVPNATIAADGSTQLKLYYVENNYKVRFYGNGATNTMPDQSFRHTEMKALSESTLTRPGYTFTGWNTAPDGSGTSYEDGYVNTQAWTDEGYVGADTTGSERGVFALYAQWTANQYKVRFAANGGTGTMADQTFTYDADGVQLTTNAFAKANYHFDGWTLSGSSVAGLNGATYDDGASVRNLTADKYVESPEAGVVTMTAKWVPDEYAIMYNLDGGELGEGVENPTSYTVETESFTLSNPTKAGYDFAGWTGTGLDGATQTVTVPTGSTGDRSYTATWTPSATNKYTVQFYLQNANDDEYTMSGETVVQGTAENPVITGATATVASNDEQLFAFVTNEQLANFVFDDANENNVSSAEVAANGTTVLKLYYNRATYNVTYNAANAPEGYTAPTGTTARYGATVAVADPASVAGYTFEGWKKDGAVVSTFVMPGANVELTGEFAANTDVSYTVNHIKLLADGTENGREAVLYNNGVTAQTVTSAQKDYTADGYEFVASYTTASNVTYTSQTSATVTVDSNGNGNLVMNMYYMPIDYQITYELAGGSVSGTNPASYTVVSDAITLVNPMRAGYTFAGWTGTGLDGATTSVTIPAGSTGNRSYTANWTPDEYTIAYNLDGGNVSVANPTTYTIESDAIALTNPTKTGYTFTGWTGTGLDGATQTVTIPTGSTGNRSYTANWTPSVYAITYDYAGGQLVNATNPGTYTIESDAIMLANPVRPGYAFAGWTGTELNSATTSVTIPAGSTGNREYTATWTPVNYNITYELNGGTVATANPTTYNIETPSFTLNNPERSGYTFTGWTGTGFAETTQAVAVEQGSLGDRSYTANWAANPDTAYKVNIYLQNQGEYDETAAPNFTEDRSGVTDTTASITDGDKADRTIEGVTYVYDTNVRNVESANINGDGGTTLVMHFKPQYTVTYDANGGAFNGDFAAVTPGLDYGAPMPAAPTTAGDNAQLTRAGYTFSSWNDTIAETVTGNVTYQAQWLANNETLYTVNIYLQSAEDGGYPTTPNQTIAKGTTDATLTAVQVAADDSVVGYISNTENTGGATYVFDAANAGNSENVTVAGDGTSSINLYYKLQFNVTYEAGEHGALVDYTAPTEATLDYNANRPEAPNYAAGTGYRFKEWSPEPADKVTANATYTATFEPITYTVAFDGNGATGGTMSAQTLTYDASDALTENAFTRTGYTFLGWATSADATTAAYTDKQSVSNLAAAQDATVTLYAVWQLDTYNITYDLNKGTGSVEPENDAANPATYNVNTPTITLAAATRTGYTFAGWTENGAAATGIPAGSTGDKAFTANWTLDRYGIAYELNGGANAVSNPVAYTVEDAAITLADPTRDGYTFAGWTEGNTIPAGSTGAKAFTATWTANADTAYKVEHYKQNLDGTYPDEPSEVDNLTGTTDATVTATPKTYEGFTHVTVEGSSLESATIAGNGSTVLKVYYGRNSYNLVYLNADGSQISTQSYAYDAQLTAADGSTANTPAGYTFDNWKRGDTSDTLNPGASFTMPAADLTLQAQQHANTDTAYTIRYVSTKPDARTIHGDVTAYGVTGAAATADHIDIAHYDYNSTSYAIEGGLIAGDGSQVVTLVYAPKSYAIDYTLDGGALAEGATNPISYSIESSAITLHNPTKAGYTFAGWTGTELDAAATDVTIAAGSTGNRSYAATWTPIVYAIAYDLAGGALDEGATNPTSYTIENDDFELANPARTGYTFRGWTGGAEDATTDVPNASVTVVKGSMGDRAYAAAWTPNTYAVHFNANGGDGAMDDQEFTYDADAQALTANAYTRAGFTYVGWNTEADGSGTAYTDQQEVANLTAEAGAVVTLYAQWAPVVVPVTTIEAAATDIDSFYNGAGHGFDLQGVQPGDVVSFTDPFTAADYSYTVGAQAAPAPFVDATESTVVPVTITRGTATATIYPTVTIRPRTIVLASATPDEPFVYDGQAHTFPYLEDSSLATMGTASAADAGEATTARAADDGTGWVPGEGLLPVAQWGQLQSLATDASDLVRWTGTQTMVGASANTFAFRLSPATKASNYDIDVRYGTITVVAPVPAAPGEGEGDGNMPGVVTKTAVGQADAVYAYGSTATFRIDATNVYDEAVTIRIADPSASLDYTVAGTSVGYSADSTAAQAVFPNVAPGATVTVFATHVITEADVLAGTYRNTANVSIGGIDALVPSADVTVEEPAGHLSVTKTAIVPEGALAVGDTISYQVLVTNDGNVTLSDVRASDPLTGDVWEAGTLAPGVSRAFTATLTVTQDDLDRGTVANLANATGTDPNGTTADVTPGGTVVPVGGGDEPDDGTGAGGTTPATPGGTGTGGGGTATPAGTAGGGAITVPGAVTTPGAAAIVPLAATTPGVIPNPADGFIPPTETIDDDANPLGAFDSEPILDAPNVLAGLVGTAGTLAADDPCWVHNIILLGALLTLAYYAGVVGRRQRHAKRLRAMDDAVMSGIPQEEQAPEFAPSFFPGAVPMGR